MKHSTKYLVVSIPLWFLTQTIYNHRPFNPTDVQEHWIEEGIEGSASYKVKYLCIDIKTTSKLIPNQVKIYQQFNFTMHDSKSVFKILKSFN